MMKNLILMARNVRSVVIEKVYNSVWIHCIVKELQSRWCQNQLI